MLMLPKIPDSASLSGTPLGAAAAAVAMAAKTMMTRADPSPDCLCVGK